MLLFLFFFLFINVASQRLNAFDTADDNEHTLSFFHRFDTTQEFTKRGEIVFLGTGRIGKYVGGENLTIGMEREYQVKFVDVESGKEVLSSVDGCFLPAAKLYEEIILHLDERGTFFHADYYAPVGDCAVEERTSQNILLATTVRISRPSTGAEVHVVKAVPLKENGKPASKTDDKPWYQKYWYLIIPIVVLAFLPGAEESQGGRK